MERDQSDANRSIIPHSESMSDQIQIGLTHLQNMIDNMRISQIYTSLDFSVYCENEIDPYSRELQACFENVASCIENMNAEYEEKIEMLTNEKGQAAEKLHKVSSEQKCNEIKISNCEDEIKEANHAKQMSLENIEDADRNIRRLRNEIREAESQQNTAGSVIGVAAVAMLFTPLTIPALFVSGAMAGALIVIKENKDRFEKEKSEEISNLNELEAKLQRKTTELENKKEKKEHLQKEICEQNQIIQDLNNEISTMKQQIRSTNDVLEIARNICRSIASVSVAVNVLKLETTNAYALEPLMIPLMELNTNLHQLFRFFPKPDKDILERSMAQIEDRQKMIKAIKFEDVMEKYF